MNLMHRLYWTAKGVGWDNVPRRLLQMFRLKSGRLRKRLAPDRFTDAAFRAACPHAEADQRELWQTRAERFFPIASADKLSSLATPSDWQRRVVEPASKAMAGEYPFFNHGAGKLGWPPDFNLDPFHDLHWPTDQHWLETARSGPPMDDLKLVWEASRFSLAYTFARAYAHDGEEKWAEAFWEMFDAWIEQNPAQLTVAWGCGQEITFRLMAMLLAACVTLKSPAATEERLYALTRFAWQSGRRIRANINYALSQKNNHGISEAVGLRTIGLLFPEFAEADAWRKSGRRLITSEVRRQIADDGSYVQNSTNYHRVMMDDLLWALRLGEINEDRLPESVYDHFARADEWLAALIDPISGRTPNYGSNDGALVLPLSACDYLDYRPVSQAAHFLLHGKRRFAPGPWDEKMLWLFGEDCLDAAAIERQRGAAWSAPVGGYYILRGAKSWLLTRCHSHRTRPGHCDMLHVDLWMRGVNVLRDGGSFMYYCDEPWRTWFKSVAAHNTIQVDGQDQMVKGPRFLWFKWTRAKLLQFETSQDGRRGSISGEHYAYRKLPGNVIHRRTIRRTGDVYVVIDQLLGDGEHDCALRWRLCAGDWRGADGVWQIDTPEGPISIFQDTPHPVRLLCGVDGERCEGWESLYYGQKQPTATLLMEGPVALPARFVTVIAPAAKQSMRHEGTSLLVETEDGSLRVNLADADG